MHRNTDHSGDHGRLDPDILDELQRRAQAPVTQRLRSVSVVIARLRELIGQAHAMGHCHAAIHARLCVAGLGVSWNNYRPDS